MKRCYNYSDKVSYMLMRNEVVMHVETVVLLSKKHVNYKEYIEIGVDDEEYYKIKGDKH